MPLVEAMSLCAERGTPGLVVNLGSDREMTVEEIARMVLAATCSQSTLEQRAAPRRRSDAAVPRHQPGQESFGLAAAHDL